MSKSLTISPFRLIGQLESFIMKDGVEVKYLHIRVGSRKFLVEITKKSKVYLETNLSPKDWLEVQGTRETKGKMGIFKLKAETVKILTQPQEPCVMIIPEKASEKRILVCEKTGCWERGGRNLYQQIKTKLVARGLGDKVEIGLTGCLKQCKKGPNAVVLPDQIQYSQLSVGQVENLLKRHFT